MVNTEEHDLQITFILFKYLEAFPIIEHKVILHTQLNLSSFDGPKLL